MSARRPLSLPPTATAVLTAVLTGLLLTACGGSDEPAPQVPDGPDVPTVDVEVGSVGRVRAEVADDQDERNRGLMGRRSVPPGTGMVFRFDAPIDTRFYMYRVPVPLTAVFARQGRIVGVVRMPPCKEQEPSACPTYGPGEPFDTVLETAPETVAGRVRVGDPMRVLG